MATMVIESRDAACPECGRDECSCFADWVKGIRDAFSLDGMEVRTMDDQQQWEGKGIADAQIRVMDCPGEIACNGCREDAGATLKAYRTFHHALPCWDRTVADCYEGNT